jgi:hypothetical protein
MSRRPARALTISSLETLEDRLVLSATSATVTAWESTVTSIGGQTLGSIYTQYVNYVESGSQGAFNPAQDHTVELIGPTVGVEFQFKSGSNFASNAALLEGAGLVETASFPSANIIEGFLPIGQLPAIAPDPNLSSMTAVMRPTTGLVPNAAAAPNSQTAVVATVGGPALGTVYQDYLNYEAAGGTGTFTSSESGQIFISGTSVGVDIQTSPANFNAMLQAMEVYGMQVTATAPQVGVIEGYLPIAQLPTVAANADLEGLAPIYIPKAR